ncbi:glucuronate isomerase [Paenibacillus sp. HJGM_3]|uniref:glucuronate isomerase n=1 Tax=Paenibacillus sp. HJGM_3 TaxID=3379816 RepID=UPI00385E9E82
MTHAATPNTTIADRQAFLDEIMQLPVLDTHTHLVGDRLAARDFWEIAHYFWLNREMQTGGYPANAADLPEDERIRAFLDAYRATRNTNMNWVLTRIFQDLYGIQLIDEASVREADAAIQRSHAAPGWAQSVADRLQIRRFVVNIPEHAEFQGTRDRAILIPRIDGRLGGWASEMASAGDPMAAYEQHKRTIDELLAGFAAQGCPGIMTTLPAYASRADRRAAIAPGIAKDEAMMELLHAICAAAERHGLLVQLFLGVERSWCGTAVPANDPARILKLTALFEQYRCRFELVVASELNNLDVVQAAWNFPNVHVGGMWWFNFRASTYRDVMQYRLEALAATASSLVVSDARCIEWSYGKIALIKKLICEFLWQQLESGWIERETAHRVAEEWLYGSAARRYGLL